MAKLNGPLCSFSASGTICGYLTYSERKSGSQVRYQRKQKDIITSARTTQRDRFKECITSWNLYDFGIQQFGFFLCGGKKISISSLPREKRAPKFACYVRDFLD